MTAGRAVIIGAGPAGLTAAWELLDRTDVVPLVLEATGEIGGLSRTVEHHGNRMDIGGHRFFSKSDRVTAWWLNILPLQGAPARDDLALGREVPLAAEARRRAPRAREAVVEPAPDPERTDGAMLRRGRVSRIFFRRRFFNYPVTLDRATVAGLGVWRMLRIGASYLATRLRPPRAEASLEDFLINRFGRELYATFFRDYTQKVWGVPCRAIPPGWGAQRIRGLSVARALQHALRRAPRPGRQGRQARQTGRPARPGDAGLAQKDVETTLIGQFMYPKLGPGQMWEEVARQVREHGGEVRLHQRVVGLRLAAGRAGGARLAAVTVRDDRTGVETEVAGDWFFSTMPVQELIAGLGEAAPPNVREVAAGLVYRDFITVGLLARRLRIRNETARPTLNGLVPDNWIYVQESDVKLGRLQVFNNWSPYLVRDPGTVWLGLEYFCDEGDELWRLPDTELAAFAAAELARIGIIDAADVLDRVVIRQPKTYPAYFGTYDRFAEIRAFADAVPNLFLLGRNGMHRYNNQDHSMLTAMTAVDNLVAGRTDRGNVWDVNVEEEYHEGK